MPEAALIRTLAAAPAFQTFAGVASAEAAALRIHRDGLPAPAEHRSHHTRAELEAARPCAIIWLEAHRLSRTAHYTWDQSGTLKVKLIRTVPAEDWADDRPDAAADSAWMTTVKAIMRGLLEVVESDGDGYLDIDEVFFNPGDIGCAPPDVVETEGAYQVAELTVNFGGAGGAA